MVVWECSMNISRVWPSTWPLRVSRSSSPRGAWPSLSPAGARSTPVSWAGIQEPAGTVTDCPGNWPRDTAPRKGVNSESHPLFPPDLLSSFGQWERRPLSFLVAGSHHGVSLQVLDASWRSLAADCGGEMTLGRISLGKISDSGHNCRITVKQPHQILREISVCLVAQFSTLFTI